MNLILADLKIPKNFSILQSPDIQIVNTGALNDGTAQWEGMINLRKDESSSGIMGNLGNTVNNRYLCNTPGIFCNTGQEETKAIIAGATYNIEYDFNVFCMTKRLKNE